MPDTTDSETGDSVEERRSGTFGETGPAARDGDATVEASDEADTDDEHRPTGTMVLMLAFLALIAAMWAFTYYTLIVRG
ncbi:MAG: cytochrome c oxidase subunit 2A [Microthrixaceae bacterium]